VEIMAKKKSLETYTTFPSEYTLCDNYVRYGYKINHIAEFLNISAGTLRKYIKDGKIPETPLILPYVGHKFISGTRLYIFEQLEGLHLGLMKYNKTSGVSYKYKHHLYNFILNEWKKIPTFKNYKDSDYVYKPLSK
jgi:hypothetical protein